MTVKFAEAWRTRTAALRERLTAEQLDALRRARSGYPPATLLGWHLARDTGASHEPPLAAVESIARMLADSFPWPEPPDLPKLGRQWVDLRHETDAVMTFLSELREALAAGRVESALLRAMTIGTMFTRLAYLLLDGEVIASGAAAGRGRPKAQAQRKVNAEEHWSEILPVLDRIERSIRSDVRGEKRWEHVSQKYSDEHQETLPIAAAQKRLRAWRRTQDDRA